VLADLAVKHFKRVEAFYMAIAPGMPISEKWKQFAKHRWGLDVREVEHWDAAKARSIGTLCFPDGNTDAQAFRDVIAENKSHFGIDFACTGTRADESLRRKQLVQQGKWPGDWHPLFHWSNKDVMDYLAIHNLPKPDQPEARMGGVSLHAHVILWLHDKYPDDYKAVCKKFPLAPAIVKRRELYGIGKVYE
jgi:phosphoadenosine phosphosulfate reductase